MTDEEIQIEREDARQLLIKNLERINHRTGPGGQVVGLAPAVFTLHSPDLNVSIKMNTYRSQLKNYEKAMLLMEMIIDDYLDEHYHHLKSYKHVSKSK